MSCHGYECCHPCSINTDASVRAAVLRPTSNRSSFGSPRNELFQRLFTASLHSVPSQRRTDGALLRTVVRTPALA
eukprot:4882588-Pleurochrysis_carterae.AAC.3